MTLKNVADIVMWRSAYTSLFPSVSSGRTLSGGMAIQTIEVKNIDKSQTNALHSRGESERFSVNACAAGAKNHLCSHGRCNLPCNRENQQS